jgi:hypothetical protein
MKDFLSNFIFSSKNAEFQAAVSKNLLRRKHII